MSSNHQGNKSEATSVITAEQLEKYLQERTAALTESNQQLRQEIHRLTLRGATLHESEEQFRMLFEQAAVGVAIVGLDGRYLNVNQKHCDMLGYTPDEMRQKSWVDITHPTHLPRNVVGNEQMLSGSAPTYTTDKQYVRADGTAIWVHLTVSLVCNPDRQPKYFIAVVEDVTARKDAQERLARSEQRLQSILDHTTAVIYIKEPDGRYELINRRFEELFHITNQEISRRTDFDLFPHDMAQAFRTNDLKVLETRMPLELEEIVEQDGKLHTYISIKVPILDANRRAVAVCGISTDITERKQAESAIRNAKESAELANLAKSRFLANVSHEIRTPIMALLGAAELIRGGELAGDQVFDHGDVILRNGRHLLSLVDDLLDQSRIDAGRLDVVRSPCSLPEIMADVYAVAAPLLKHPVDLQIIYENDVPEFITTDRTRLTQALINLVHNAIKFTSKGHIHVRVSLDRVEGSPFLAVGVEDTGLGIAQADMNRIFEPFMQLDMHEKHPSSGIGLGLPLARWIAQRLGGSLDVRSQLGTGSTFSLRIPVGPLSPGEWTKPREASKCWRLHQENLSRPQPGLRGSVLLAEDVPDVRRLLTHALERAGATVLAVEDGRPAIAAVQQRTFDLILLDIRMPDVDGLEAARSIRSLGYSGPLIAMTASTTRMEHERILAAGFDEIWPKPISLQRFVELASAYLESSPRYLVPPKEATDARIAAIRAEFAAGLPSCMNRLRTALKNGHNDSVGDILHQLLGSSGIHGFMDFSAQVGVVYDQFKAGHLSSDSGSILRLQEMMRQIGG